VVSIAGSRVQPGLRVFLLALAMADPPSDSTDRQLLGVAASAGMGFTVALFITGLAFSNQVQRANATLGILIAAVVAATLSLTILTPRRDHPTPT
jgi:NhaA family Na+:H+ antiporter